jgi:ABC-type lipoprotein export system ATPase subunit
MTVSTDPMATPHAPSAPHAHLVAEVLEQLATSSRLPAQAAALVLEALQGTEEPGQTALRGVYLKSITVEGFRGIGEPATLHLPFGPGLTVVQGRNGSGKSSFAEAIEVALTGHNRRWEGGEDGKGAQPLQQDGWRNLHHAGARRLELQLHASGSDLPLALTRRWTGDGFGDAETAVRGLTGPTPQPVAALGWQEDLHAYRPILSYSELGQMMNAKPSQMYDRLATLLGLGALSDAAERLATRERLLAQHEKEAKAALPEILEALNAAQDERARRAAGVLGQRVPDRELIRSLIAGNAPAEAVELHRLHQLATLIGPDTAQITAAADDVRKALTRVEQTSADDAGDALAHAEVLEQALRLHTRRPAEHTCPVCQSPDVLDAAWAEQAAARIAALRESAALADAARQALREAANNLRALCHNPPAHHLPEHLQASWDAWAKCRGILDPAELAVAVEERAADLADACRQVREDAQHRLAELDGQWCDLVPRLAAWLSHADEAAAAKPVLAQVKKAKSWLKDVHTELRDTRMRAIAAQAQEIWGYLSQESNVDLGAVSLSGSENYSGRGVTLNVTVDDVDAAALGVVSQGELFSLALALFLPRATSGLSPFNFIVIDDPVQSMDPRKVEGLARLLEKVAATHQVVVFTHDTRLTEVLRYHRIKATIREVRRGQRSTVTVAPCDDPVKRELDAARALVKDSRITPEVLGEILPGQCRLALEAALREPAQRKLVSARLGHTEIAERIVQAHQLTELAALALFGAKRDKRAVYQELERRVGAESTQVIELCNKGAHSTIMDITQADHFVKRAAEAAERLRTL